MYSLLDNVPKNFQKYHSQPFCLALNKYKKYYDENVDKNISYDLGKGTIRIPSDLSFKCKTAA